MILCFFHMHLLFASAYLCIAWHIPPLISFSTIYNISVSGDNPNLVSVFFKQASHANPGADKK